MSLQALIDATYATTAEALSGASEVKRMTPARTRDVLRAGTGVTPVTRPLDNIAEAALNRQVVQGLIDAGNPLGQVIQLPAGMVYFDRLPLCSGSNGNKDNVILRGAGRDQTTVYLTDPDHRGGIAAIGGKGHEVTDLTIDGPTPKPFPFIVPMPGLSQSDGRINNPGGYSAGATQINLDGTLAGRVGPGDGITINNENYIIQAVTEASANELTGVRIYPGLVAPVADNTQVFFKQYTRRFGITDDTVDRSGSFSSATIPAGSNNLRLHFNTFDLGRGLDQAIAVGDQFFLVATNNVLGADPQVNYDILTPYRVATVGSLVGSLADGGYWPITVEHWDGSQWVPGLATDHPNGRQTTNIQDYRNNLYCGLFMIGTDNAAFRRVWVKSSRLHSISMGTMALNSPNAYVELGSTELHYSNHVVIEDCWVGDPDDPLQLKTSNGHNINCAYADHVRITGCKVWGNRRNPAPPGEGWGNGIFCEKNNVLHISDNQMHWCQEGYRFASFNDLVWADNQATDCELGLVLDQNHSRYVLTGYNIQGLEYPEITKGGIFIRSGTPRDDIVDNRDSIGVIGDGLIHNVGSATYGTNAGIWIRDSGSSEGGGDNPGVILIDGAVVTDCFGFGILMKYANRVSVADAIVTYCGLDGYFEEGCTDCDVVGLRCYDNDQRTGTRAGMRIRDKTRGTIANTTCRNYASGTQRYGVIWEGAHTDVNIGLGNEWAGWDGIEAGTRPAMRAELRGKLFLDSPQSSGTLANTLVFMGRNTSDVTRAYAEVMAAVVDATPGNEKGELRLANWHNGTRYNAALFRHNLRQVLGYDGATYTDIIRSDANGGVHTEQLFQANNDADEVVTYAEARHGILNNTDGNESGQVIWRVISAGAETDAVRFGPGLLVPGAAAQAAYQGFGTVDIDGSYYQQGEEVIAGLGGPINEVSVTVQAGTMPNINGLLTIADADNPTAREVLHYVAEVEAKLYQVIDRMRARRPSIET